MTIAWTHMRDGHQHVKGDHSTWVSRCGESSWVCSVGGLGPWPGETYQTGAQARAAVEGYLAAGLHRLPYSERVSLLEAS